MNTPATITSGIIHGGGEMGKIVRAKDWSQTPLDTIESWPQSLRTTVNLCLASNFPISIAWGPQRVQIYNDGYWPICGAKHPQSMGQDFKQCWFSAWPAIGEAFERASAGETAFLENQRMFLDRNGYLEETFFTFSFSPIRDETGAVAGLFHPVTEMTQQTLAERRLKVLRDVADSTADATSVDEAMARLAQAIARHELDLPFALLYRLDAKGQEVTLAQSIGLRPGADASPVQVNLQSDASRSWPLAEAANSPRPLLIQHLPTRFAALRCGPYPEPPSQAFVLPIVLPGQSLPIALLVAGVSSRRALDGPYRTFFEMLGAAVTSALSKAHTYEQERKRAETLAQLDRAKTMFFSNVSHEFRTPLTLLLGPLEEELRQNPGSRDRLEVAHRNSLRLLKLVNTLLDFSRLEVGRLDAVFEPTELAAFTRDLASIFRSAVEKAGLRLLVDCPPLPEPVYVDREMWEKVVLNLLSNALKFTFQGEIRVALRETEKRVELSVSDTGVGIPQAELPRVFERFHRVRGTRARSHEGTGIGLALVRELARLHGGEASVVSQEGRGTTFTVCIPTGSAHLPKERIGAAHTLASTALGATPFIQEALRWLPEEPATAIPPPALENLVPAAPHQPSPASEPKPRVLLADDNADMRDYLRRLLGERYEVLAVPDGEAALDTVREKKVDLVISDVMMPRLDGFALLRALRSDPATQTLPVLLLSARAGEEARLQGLQAGADGYLAKPFSARELLARVETSLTMARIRSEAQAAVRASEIRYRRLFETAKDGVLLLDPYTRKITDTNPFIEHLLGYSHEELVGKELWQIGLLKDANASRAAFEQLRREGQIRYADFPLQAKTGETRDVEFVSYLYDEDGRSVIQCNIRDITARKQAEEVLKRSKEELERLVNERTAKLREAMAELEHMSYSMVHDMRAPLRAMQSFAGLLQEECADCRRPPARDYLQRIQDSSNRLDRLVTDALNYNKIVRQDLPMTSVDLGALLQGMIQSYPNLQPPAGITLEFGELPVLGNESLLTQVFGNLLGNAVKFVAPGVQPRIRVWAEMGDTEMERHGDTERIIGSPRPRVPASSTVRVFVEDNGIGIPEDAQEKIFHMFQRMHRENEYPGTGIGLAIVRKAVERMGGRVGLQSEPGQGSKFWVELPEAAAQAQTRTSFSNAE